MTRTISAILVSASLGLFIVPEANAALIQFSITNTSPSGGLWIMRPWIGIQDGGFTTYTQGQTASPGVLHEAEDGVTGDPANLLPPPNACSGNAAVYSAAAPCLYGAFNAYAGHGVQASVGNPTAPGATLSTVFDINPSDLNSQYLSYLVMIVPSNDAFFGTPTSGPIKLFDANLRFNGGNGPISIPINFANILDAGTEINTESPSDTAFLGQAINGTGPRENGVVHNHDLFGNSILTGSNGFGGRTNTFQNANFQGQIAVVTISQIPEPATFEMIVLLAAVFGVFQLGRFHTRQRGPE